MQGLTLSRAIFGLTSREYFKETWQKIKRLDKIRIKESPIKKEYVFPPNIIKIKEDIPFIPYNRQIMYYETSYNEVINDYILKNTEKLQKDFAFLNYSLELMN